jgi:hypothetical protein
VAEMNTLQTMDVDGNVSLQDELCIRLYRK